MRACTITKFGPYSRWSFYDKHSIRRSNKQLSIVSNDSFQKKSPHLTVGRALRAVEQIFYSNSFKYFVTLTFSKRSVYDRQSYEAVKKRLSDVLNEFTRKYSITYLLVPDFHEDGAVHFHGFMNVPDEALRRTGSFRLFKAGARAPKFYSPFLNARLGRNDFRPLLSVFGRSSVRYVLKYVTKAAKLARDGSQSPLYVRSRGLASFTSQEHFHGDDAVFLEEFLPNVTVKRKTYDYDVCVFPYVDESTYDDVFRAFYGGIWIRSLPCSLPVKRQTSNAVQISFPGSSLAASVTST